MPVERATTSAICSGPTCARGGQMLRSMGRARGQRLETRDRIAGFVPRPDTSAARARGPGRRALGLHRLDKEVDLLRVALGLRRGERM
jgi:hypothetical protein